MATAVQHTGTVQALLLFEFLLLIQAGCPLQTQRESESRSWEYGTSSAYHLISDKGQSDLRTDNSRQLVLSALDFSQMENTRHHAIRPCWNCHVRQSGYRRQEFNKPVPQVCYDCHEDHNGPNKYLHGPVSVGACTICHNPHISTYVHLLRTSQPRLCTRCHNTEDYHARVTGPDASEKLCTECHDPHASTQHMFPRE